MKFPEPDREKPKVAPSSSWKPQASPLLPKKLSLRREACATADLDKELAVGRLVAGCELQDVTGNIFKGLGFRVWDLGFGVLGFGFRDATGNILKGRGQDYLVDQGLSICK